MTSRPGANCAALYLWALAPMIAAGCDREPIDVQCAVGDVGGLVVSEVRGPQRGDDSYGEWIELYNASGATIDLRGLRVTLVKLDGSSSPSFVIRDYAEVEVGGFFVLGRALPGEEPDHVDYGYGDDFDSKLPTGAAITLSSCGQMVDRMIHRSLPSRGTFAFDGSLIPDHAGNDDETAWCVDDAEDEEAPQLGIRGSPGERNPPCEG